MPGFLEGSLREKEGEEAQGLNMNWDRSLGCQVECLLTSSSGVVTVPRDHACTLRGSPELLSYSPHP